MIEEDVDLSVVIVSYNTCQLLDECLASVYVGQGELRLEVWVVDNQSTDGSVTMVRQKYPSVKLIANNTNRGFAAANNQALQEAAGEFLLLLNSDTLIIDDVLTASVHHMRENRSTGALGCRVLNGDRSLQLTCFRWPSLLVLLLTASGLAALPLPAIRGFERIAYWRRDSRREVDAITGCYLLMRRTVCEQIGWLDEAFFFYGEETDWCRRASHAGWIVEFAPVGEIVHYGGASGSALGWRRKLMLASALIRLQRKHCGLLSAAVAFLLLLAQEIRRAVMFELGAIFFPARFAAKAQEARFALWNFRLAWPSSPPNS